MGKTYKWLCLLNWFAREFQKTMNEDEGKDFGKHCEM